MSTDPNQTQSLVMEFYKSFVNNMEQPRYVSNQSLSIASSLLTYTISTATIGRSLLEVLFKALEKLYRALILASCSDLPNLVCII